MGQGRSEDLFARIVIIQGSPFRLHRDDHVALNRCGAGDAAHSRTYLLPTIYPSPLVTAFGMDGDFCCRRDDDVYSIFIYV